MSKTVCLNSCISAAAEREARTLIGNAWVFDYPIQPYGDRFKLSSTENGNQLHYYELNALQKGLIKKFDFSYEEGMIFFKIIMVHD